MSKLRLIGSRWGAGAIGIVCLLILWTLAGVFHWFKGTIPTPAAVIRAVGKQGWDFYTSNFGPTIELASKGFLWGNLLALILALLVIVIPQIEGLATQLAIISYCTPIIAVAPIVQVAFSTVQTMIVFLAAISVFFTTMIGAVAGLRSPHRAALDVVQVYGGGRLAQLFRVRIISSLPNVLAALKIAAPAVILGAVLGEFLAMPDKGAGPAMINAQQRGDIPAVWAIALVCGVIAGIGYAVIALISRYVTRWSTGEAR